MESPLPSITYQRRKLFRPSYADIKYVYNAVNRYCFDNRLRMPEIEQRQLKGVWGFCQWENEEQNNGSHCFINIVDKWFCPQWFVQTLAHEMVHQYQWDIHRFEYTLPTDSGAHGPSFFMWRDRFEHYSLNLKTAHGQKRWFKHQDFTKC
jgi:hypothetical protein